MATTLKSARKRVRLVERVGIGAIGADRIDRDAQVIKGVKVLGTSSSNGRRYAPEAVRKAASLYEGAKVYCDHPERPSAQRSVHESLGQLRNVRVGDDGCLYADLHYMASHPMSARLLEAAERMPDQFGLSHNVQGDTGAGPDGVEVVYEIVEVRSVDLVADPATTGGLFEGKRMKLRAYLESVQLKGKKRAVAGKQKLLRRLFEAGVMDAEMDAPGEPPAPEAGGEGHADALKGGFEAAIAAVVSDCLGGGDCKAGIKKIGEMLKSHEKLASDGAVKEGEGEDLEEEEDEDLEEDRDDDGEGKPVKESAELKLLRREKRGRQLCEEAGVPCDSVLLESLARLPDEAAMKRLIEREQNRGTPAQRPAPSRAGSGGGKKGQAEARAGDDTAEFMAAARG